MQEYFNRKSAAANVALESGTDKVVVLSDGRVAEQGSPEELLDTGEIYSRMVKAQMIGMDWGI